MTTASPFAAAISILTANGYSCRDWNGKRLYVRRNGEEVGYLSVSDLTGGTGTCKNVTRRSGFVGDLLRSVRAA
jgi:hypothetical protein